MTKTAYAYDARGNQTQQVQTGTGVTTTSTYGYDLANRLISSGISNNAVIPLSTSATYAYNAQGQRVTRVEDEVITHFYYTGSALLFTTVNEYVLQTQNILDPSGTIVASKRFEGQAETEQDPYAEDYFFYRYDIRGSVTNIVDGAGSVVKSYDYDEFGVTTSTGDTFFNEVTFTGSVADASGLLYMNARYYNPSTARFLSQDTYTGSASVPWTQHLYAYCNNNPVNMVDPTGHRSIYRPLRILRVDRDDGSVTPSSPDPTPGSSGSEAAGASQNNEETPSLLTLLNAIEKRKSQIVVKYIGQPLLDITRFLTKVFGKGTMVRGVEGSFAFGVRGSFSFGIATDNNGNVALVGSAAGGGGTPSAGVGAFVTKTNAPTIAELGGRYVQGGGSYGEGMIGGGDISWFGPEGGNIIYTGKTISVSVGANIPVPGEIHGEVGKTKIFYRVNVFDVIQSYFDEIMER